MIKAAEPIPAVTLEMAYEKFKEVGKLAASTIKIYDGYMRNHLAHWWDTDLNEITEDDLLDYFDDAPNKAQAYKALITFGAIWKKMSKTVPA